MAVKNHKVVERLLEFFSNSPTSAGIALGTTRQNVNLWIVKGYIPPRWASLVETATGKKITALEVMETAIFFQDPANKKQRG